nr:hypothetical protein B0A51_04981 [Rachicladosporium sp. CCFEE 5018]
MIARKTARPERYYELLEEQQSQLVAAVQEMYWLLQVAGAWQGSKLAETNGRPFVHDIVAALGLPVAQDNTTGELEVLEENSSAESAASDQSRPASVRSRRSPGLLPHAVETVQRRAPDRVSVPPGFFTPPSLPTEKATVEMFCSIDEDADPTASSWQFDTLADDAAMIARAQCDDSLPSATVAMQSNDSAVQGYMGWTDSSYSMPLFPTPLLLDDSTLSFTCDPLLYNPTWATPAPALTRDFGDPPWTPQPGFSHIPMP